MTVKTTKITVTFTFVKFAAMMGGRLRTRLVELEAKDVKIKVQARQYMW